MVLEIKPDLVKVGEQMLTEQDLSETVKIKLGIIDDQTSAEISTIYNYILLSLAEVGEIY